MSSSDVFRLCFVNLGSSFVKLNPSIQEGQVYEGRPKFEGPLASTFNAMLQVLVPKKVSNYSARIENKFGDFDDQTGQYDGCVGSLQRNESDTFGGQVAFPTQAFDTINPVQIFAQEPLAIIQGYKPTYRTDYADTLKAALPAFTPDLWMLTFFTLMVFMATFKLKVSLRNWGKKVMKRKRRAKKDYSIYEVLSLFIQQDSSDYSDKTRSYLSLLITGMSFILINSYFCNLMSTEQVIVPKPIVLKSYMDFLTRSEVTPFFLFQLDDHEYFKSGNPTLKPWWNKMVMRVKNESALFIDVANLEGILPVINDAVKLKRSLIVNNLYKDIGRKTVCYAGAVLQFRDMLVWSQIDQKLDKQFAKIAVVRKAEGNAMIAQISRQLRAAGEMGVQLQIFKQVNTMVYLSEFLGPNTDTQIMQNCMSNVLIMEQPDQMPSSITNLKSVFALFFTFNFIAFFVLCYERRQRIC